MKNDELLNETFDIVRGKYLLWQEAKELHLIFNSIVKKINDKKNNS